MRLSEIMNTRVVTSRPDEAASTAWTRMRRRSIRHLVVMDGSRLVGVLSERDLGGRTGTEMRKGRTVGKLMTPSVLSAQPETTVSEAADLMRERLIGCLPVMDGDALAGIVTATDVFDALGIAATGSRGPVEERLLRAPTTSKRLGGRPVARRRSTVVPTKRAVTSSGNKRDPLPEALPRASKRGMGRTEAPLTPANIRALGMELDQDARDYMRSKLGKKLGKYATSIERITVRLRDVNGPRGGVDRSCRIKVVLSGLPSVVFEAQGASAGAAFDSALDGAERSVRRSVQLRRTKPIIRGRGKERAISAPPPPSP
ncbi:MAG TPA: CBS domain-containing protein [Gemmatimonadaceae bacterium]